MGLAFFATLLISIKRPKHPFQFGQKTRIIQEKEKLHLGSTRMGFPILLFLVNVNRVNYEARILSRRKCAPCKSYR